MAINKCESLKSLYALLTTAFKTIVFFRGEADIMMISEQHTFKYSHFVNLWGCLKS